MPNLFPKSMALLAKSVIPAIGVVIIALIIAKAIRRFFKRVKMKSHPVIIFKVTGLNF